MKTSIFWFRRDLRFLDNTALWNALEQSDCVIPIFIFDSEILEDLDKNDARVSFIYDCLAALNSQLNKHGSSLKIYKGEVLEVWRTIIDQNDIETVFFNRDYEPYATERDQKIKELLFANEIECKEFKDQVIFEKLEITKADGKPYTIYTPYKNKWLERFQSIEIDLYLDIDYNKFQKNSSKFPSINEIGFEKSSISVKPFNLSVAHEYSENRNIPSLDHISYLGPHLRFGTVSIRELVLTVKDKDIQFLYELIWREFFMQIISNFSYSSTRCFKQKYEAIQWRNNVQEFEAWCAGQTGFPIVDAGMRELNATGYMHNRVRMIVASFLVKNLLIDWRWGEAYFANKLLDYELSSNVGNWQWAAGTGCDAAPYFRIFNPTEQTKRFDKDLVYIKKWVPEFQDFDYVQPIVDYKYSRERALEVYKRALT